MADGSNLIASAVNPRSAPDEVWARVREDYLAGEPAAAVARRHGVGLTTLRDRAAREGWRRADQPWRPPSRLDPWDEGVELDDRVHGDLDRVEARDLSWVAHRRMMRAVLQGDAGEALRWRRVREAMDHDETETQRWLAEDEALAFQRNGRTDPDSPDSPDPVF